MQENELNTNERNINELNIMDLVEHLEGREFRLLKEHLNLLNEADIAEFFEEIPMEKVVVVFRMLNKEQARRRVEPRSSVPQMTFCGRTAAGSLTVTDTVLIPMRHTACLSTSIKWISPRGNAVRTADFGATVR